MWSEEKAACTKSTSANRSKKKRILVMFFFVSNLIPQPNDLPSLVPPPKDYIIWRIILIITCMITQLLPKKSIPSPLGPFSSVWSLHLFLTGSKSSSISWMCSLGLIWVDLSSSLYSRKHKGRRKLYARGVLSLSWMRTWGQRSCKRNRPTFISQNLHDESSKSFILTTQQRNTHHLTWVWKYNSP